MKLANAPVHIVPYDPEWPRRFDAERQLLADAIGAWLVAGAIEHVGSTSIPGLDAKPVIDIMAGVESLEGSREALPVLEGYEYCYAPYRTEVMHWFANPHRRIVRTIFIWSRTEARSGSNSSRFATTCERTPTWHWNTRR